MSAQDELTRFREQLNAVDGELVALLARRFDICRAVAELKREHGIPMMQPARVAEVKERCAVEGIRLGLQPEFVRTLYGAIIGEACRMEDEIIEHSAPPQFSRR